MRKTNLNLIEILMEEAEKLTDDKLTGRKLAEEIQKANSLVGVSEQITALKEQAVHELDVNIKAVKVAASVGMKFKPDGLNLEPLETPAALGYKGDNLKGITPEGLPYEL